MSNHYVEWLEKQHDHMISQIRSKEKLIGEQIAALTDKTMVIENLNETINSQSDQIFKIETENQKMRVRISDLEQLNHDLEDELEKEFENDSYNHP